ncbi:MAG: hypothetical protein DMG99_17160 [Acidobacteria bacterium]|nr:MAG: hypothetical protein DMG99_17160 [Acidobacteriota bacterium]
MWNCFTSDSLSWGLIPWCATDPSGAAGMINAPSESAAIKTAFRDALKSRRCRERRCPRRHRGIREGTDLGRRR